MIKGLLLVRRVGNPRYLVFRSFLPQNNAKNPQFARTRNGNFQRRARSLLLDTRIQVLLIYTISIYRYNLVSDVDAMIVSRGRGRNRRHENFALERLRGNAHVAFGGALLLAGFHQRQPRTKKVTVKIDFSGSVYAIVEDLRQRACGYFFASSAKLAFLKTPRRLLVKSRIKQAHDIVKALDGGGSMTDFQVHHECD